MRSLEPARGAGVNALGSLGTPADDGYHRRPMPLPERPGLSVVLPVYNEALVLERTFGELLPFLEGLDGLAWGFEVVCIDDGSRDGSAEMLKRVAARDGRVRVRTLPENRGKGAAVRAGVL